MVVGLSTLFAAYGKVFRSRRTFATTAGDRPTITALIPALNEERTIGYALLSLAIQTVPPDKVVVVDDGSTDNTPAIVDELSEELHLDIERRRHDVPMGKTVGMKEVAREADTDTLFILDADTFLESPDYLEQLVEPHVDSDVASSFGMAYPIEVGSKQEFYDDYATELLGGESIAIEHIQADLETATSRSGIRGYLDNNGPTIQYRNVDYHIQQRFYTDGIMRTFGSTLFPVGAAVLYDRRKLVSVFDDYDDSLGDDLTNSEDIFLGFAFCDRGWTNVHLHDTYMRSEVPGFWKTFKQNYLWGSGYLQSAYYFKQLTFRFRERRISTDGGRETEQTSIEYTDIEAEQRSEEASTEPEPSLETRRPMGRIITSQLIDGLYPTTALVLFGLSFVGLVALELILLFILLEFFVAVFLTGVTHTKRLKFLRNLVPFVLIRAVMLPVLTYTYLRVGSDIALGNRDWRK
jgi:glycosyltransferase involved in cell wall biosynthesis